MKNERRQREDIGKTIREGKMGNINMNKEIRI